MNPRGHIVEIEIPEVEVSIETTRYGEPYSEINERPTDEVVKSAAETIITRHYPEFLELCEDLQVEDDEERAAMAKWDRMEDDREYDRLYSR